MREIIGRVVVVLVCVGLLAIVAWAYPRTGPVVLLWVPLALGLIAEGWDRRWPAWASRFGELSRDRKVEHAIEALFYEIAENALALSTPQTADNPEAP